jgi:hypothetical protein
MIFDIKIDDTRKARFVAWGHVMDPPMSITYSCAIARDSMRLVFLIATLNDLDMRSDNIRKTFLNLQTKERVNTTCVLKFGSNLIGQTAAKQCMV